MKAKPTIVIGLGNPLMADEGIGTKLIELLQCRAAEFPLVEFVDAGSGGMNILHLITGREKAVIIDCALMSAPPGSIKRFTLDDIETKKSLSRLSLHEVDIIKVVELSQNLGQGPDEIVFFGIEPEIIAQKMVLSGTLQKNLHLYIETILKELR
jgi:hydrogenase maturation protease